MQVVQRRTTLKGYELYLVEQWACSRKDPTLVVVTYTGDETHSVIVGVLSVPADEAHWSANLSAYFRATRKNLARPKETNLGELMVTNLSSFPSALTVIPVPDGDIRNHRVAFIVNENLKRLGCSGRSGLTLSTPAEGTRAKFQSLYRTSDKVPFATSVMELIKLCQVALHLFDKLHQAYIDGLLCDATEKAIGDWWTEVGAEHYNFDPADGILGPSTVAALLGMLMGARNRLYYYGAPVSKDVFDIEGTKKGILHFQKSCKLDRTKRLDRPTLVQLYNVTAKAAAGAEGWGVQKAVKSRVTEFGGKRGEIVMGMVSGKDKGGLADVETLNLEQFISLVSGERAKWLWYGKPRRAGEAQEQESDETGMNFGKDEVPSSSLNRATSLPTDDSADPRRNNELQTADPDPAPNSTIGLVDGPADRDALRKTVFKSVAGKVSDARGRIKGAVGGSRKGHSSRPSMAGQDMLPDMTAAPLPFTAENTSSPAIAGVGRAFTWKQKPQEYLEVAKQGGDIFGSASRIATGSRDPSSFTVDSKQGGQVADSSKELLAVGSEIRKDVTADLPSTAASMIDEVDLQGRALEAERKDDEHQLTVLRRQSLEVSTLAIRHVIDDGRWPRRMSFGDAEDAILTWDEIVEIGDSTAEPGNAVELSAVIQHLQQNIDDITQNVEPWVEAKLKAVSLLDERFARDKDDLHSLHVQLNEACQRVRYDSNELLTEERSNLTTSVKEIETLVARLDYEINALVSKVGDVEDGVLNFELQVQEVEKRADELRSQLETESWLHWFVRTLTGVGTGPQILRESRRQQASGN